MVDKVITEKNKSFGDLKLPCCLGMTWRFPLRTRIQMLALRHTQEALRLPREEIERARLQYLAEIRDEGPMPPEMVSRFRPEAFLDYACQSTERIVKTIVNDECSIWFNMTFRRGNIDIGQAAAEFSSCHTRPTAMHQATIPAEWHAQPGLITALYKSEGLQFEFHSQYAFAVKIGAGGINGVNGEPWRPGLQQTPTQSYLVLPEVSSVDWFRTSRNELSQLTAFLIKDTGRCDFAFEVTPVRVEAYFEKRIKSKLPATAYEVWKQHYEFMRAPQPNAWDKPSRKDLGAPEWCDFANDPWEPGDWDEQQASSSWLHVCDPILWWHITRTRRTFRALSPLAYRKSGEQWRDDYAEDCDKIRNHSSDESFMASLDGAGIDIDGRNYAAVIHSEVAAQALGPPVDLTPHAEMPGIHSSGVQVAFPALLLASRTEAQRYVAEFLENTSERDVLDAYIATGNRSGWRPETFEDYLRFISLTELNNWVGIPSCSLRVRRTYRCIGDAPTKRIGRHVEGHQLRSVDLHRTTVPPEWREKGGVITPLYRSEGLTFCFSSRMAFAIKVGYSGMNAVSGLKASPGVSHDPRDYFVLPELPELNWSTLEALGAHPAKDGRNAHLSASSILVEIIPIKAEAYFAKRVRPRLPSDAMGAWRSHRYSHHWLGRGWQLEHWLEIANQWDDRIPDDPWECSDWDLNNAVQIWVHVCDPLLWWRITGEAPLRPPLTEKHYRDARRVWREDYAADIELVERDPNLTMLRQLITRAKENDEKSRNVR